MSYAKYQNSACYTSFSDLLMGVASMGVNSTYMYIHYIIEVVPIEATPINKSLNYDGPEVACVLL